MMEMKTARHRCNDNRAHGATAQCRGEAPRDSIAGAWTTTQCRAIEIGLGGGWLLLAVLAVVA